MSKLLLFSNQNAKNAYIESIYNGKVIDTTNIQTMPIFCRSLINSYDVRSSLGQTLISKDIATIYLAYSFESYIKKNRHSIFYGQPNKYEVANSIYLLYSHIELLSNELNFNIYDQIEGYSESIKDSINIIEDYKKIIRDNNLYDECMLFNDFTDNIKNGNINKALLNYKTIEVHGFDNIPKHYSILLYALKEYSGINVDILMPYDINILSGNLKTEYILPDSKNFNICYSEISSFAKSLITLDANSIEVYKDNISLLSGFGESQEIDNTLDVIVSILQSGVPPYDITIISGDSGKYNDLLIEKCRDYNITLISKKGTPLWAIPIIPIMTSVFSILSYKSGGTLEINVDELLKLLTSPYTKIDFINHSNIRDIFYSRSYFNFYNKMKLNDFIFALKKDNLEDGLKNIASSVLTIIEKIKELSIKDSFSKISSKYLSLIKYLEVAESLKKNSSSYFYRDYHALSLFIETIISISIKSIKIDTNDYSTILNIIIRSLYVTPEERHDSGVSLLSLNEAIGSRFSHVFILGMNSNFLVRNVDTFIVESSYREKINSDLNVHLFETKESVNNLSKSLFFSLLASFSNETKVYFSFMYKDSNGNISLPSSYLEELFLLLSDKVFSFENLKSEGLIYRKNYIEKASLAYSYKEKLMSLFYYKNTDYKFDDNNIHSIIESVYQRNIKNETDLLQSKEIEGRISKYFLSKNMSVGDIEDLMLCPQYFIDKKIMGDIKGLGKEAGMCYQDKGTYFHNVFEVFYSSILKKYGTSLLKPNMEKDYNSVAYYAISSVINGIKVGNNIDLKSLEIDMKETLNLFIEKECKKYSPDNLYMPYIFERKFQGYKVYSIDGFDLKVNGRIDRVDIYKNNSNIVKGLRVVDYKLSLGSSTTKMDSIDKKTILTEYLQPLIYLAYIMGEYQESENIIENASIAFSTYKKSDIIDDKYFYEFNDKGVLLELLGYSGDDNIIDESVFTTLNKYLSSVFDNFYRGIIDYFPESKLCSRCGKSERCPHAIIGDVF